MDVRIALFLARILLTRVALIAFSIALVLKWANPHIAFINTFAAALNLIILGSVVTAVVGAGLRAVQSKPRHGELAHRQDLFGMDRFPCTLDYTLGAMFLLQLVFIISKF